MTEIWLQENLTGQQGVGKLVTPYMRNEIYASFKKDANRLGDLELTGDKLERGCTIDSHGPVGHTRTLLDNESNKKITNAWDSQAGAKRHLDPSGMAQRLEW